MNQGFVMEASNTSLCNGCGGNQNVMWYCKNCPASICSDCRTRHEASPMTKDHLIIFLSGNNTGHSCSKHPDKIKMFHCKDCREDVCTRCVEDLHLGHAVRMDNTSTLQQGRILQEKENVEMQRQHQSLNIGFPTVTTQQPRRQPAFNPYIIQQEIQPFNADCAWVFGFLTCLCCVWPIGLIAIGMAYKAQHTAEDEHDIEMAKKWRMASYGLSALSCVSGILILVLIFTVIL